MILFGGLAVFLNRQTKVTASTILRGHGGSIDRPNLMFINLCFLSKRQINVCQMYRSYSTCTVNKIANISHSQNLIL